MIFNIQVELDWIEDGSVDEEVRKYIINGIVRELKKEIVGDLKQTAMKTASEKVDEWIMAELHRFADRKITITDKWGDATEHHESLTDMFKAKFDEFFNASVDKDGKTLQSCGYGSKRMTRIDYLLEKKATEYMEKITKDMDYKIRNALDEAKKEAIANRIKDHVEKVAGLRE